MIYLQALAGVAAVIVGMVALYGVAVVVQDYYLRRRADRVLSAWHHRLTN